MINQLGEVLIIKALNKRALNDNCGLTPHTQILMLPTTPNFSFEYLLHKRKKINSECRDIFSLYKLTLFLFFSFLLIGILEFKVVLEYFIEKLHSNETL